MQSSNDAPKEKQMTRTVTRTLKTTPASQTPIKVTVLSATSPELKAAAKRKATLEAKAAAAVKERDAIAVKPTRKAKTTETAKPTRKGVTGKGKVISRNHPKGHSLPEVGEWLAGHGWAGDRRKQAREKLRRAGLNAPYALADVKRVLA